MICKYINNHVAELLVHAFITSRLDMGNSVLYNLNKSQVYRLQRLQNNAARVVTMSKKRVSISSLLKPLHWLRIEQRIEYKISLLVFKAMSGSSPSYLCNLVQPYVPARENLRSADQFLLVEHRAHNSWGGRLPWKLSNRHSRPISSV